MPLISSASVRQAFAVAFECALSAVDPTKATAEAIAAMAPLREPITVLALGKAAAAMAKGAMKTLGPTVISGIVVSPDRLSLPEPLHSIQGNHPLPGQGSLAAGEALLRAASSTVGTLLVLLSGGGSALAEVPAEGLSIDDLAQTQKVMLRSGMPVEAVNLVRRHLSKLKNGGLLRASSAPVVSLLLSDVGAAPASAIASGPTLDDGTSPTDALELLRHYDLIKSVHHQVIDALGRAGIGPGAQASHTWKVIADGATAVDAVAASLKAQGLAPTVITTELRGDAATMACHIVSISRPGKVGIAAGETSVNVVGEYAGGRNQHAALAAALDIEATASVFAALSTDGCDGSTSAAGAVVDGGTCRRIRSLGMDPKVLLASCDSHRGLAASGDLVITGPTGTNVADLWMVWRNDDSAV